MSGDQLLASSARLQQELARQLGAVRRAGKEAGSSNPDANKYRKPLPSSLLTRPAIPVKGPAEAARGPPLPKNGVRRRGVGTGWMKWPNDGRPHSKLQSAAEAEELAQLLGPRPNAADALVWAKQSARQRRGSLTSRPALVSALTDRPPTTMGIPKAPAWAVQPASAAPTPRADPDPGAASTPRARSALQPFLKASPRARAASARLERLIAGLNDGAELPRGGERRASQPQAHAQARAQAGDGRDQRDSVLEGEAEPPTVTPTRVLMEALAARLAAVEEVAARAEARSAAAHQAEIEAAMAELEEVQAAIASRTPQQRREIAARLQQPSAGSDGGSAHGSAICSASGASGSSSPRARGVSWATEAGEKDAAAHASVPRTLSQVHASQGLQPPMRPPPRPKGHKKGHSASPSGPPAATAPRPPPGRGGRTADTATRPPHRAAALTTAPQSHPPQPRPQPPPQPRKASSAGARRGSAGGGSSGSSSGGGGGGGGERRREPGVWSDGWGPDEPRRDTADEACVHSPSMLRMDFKTRETAADIIEEYREGMTVDKLRADSVALTGKSGFLKGELTSANGK